MKRIVILFSALALVSIPAFAADKKIERLWKSKCSSCHGMDGKGNGPAGVGAPANRGADEAKVQIGRASCRERV